MYNAIAKYLGEGGTILEAKGQLKNTLTNRESLGGELSQIRGGNKQ